MWLRIQELFICMLLGVILYDVAFAIRCNRVPEGVHSPKSSGDNRFEIKINGNPDKYVAGGDYTVILRGVRSGRHRPTFKRFMLVVQPSYSHNSYSVIGYRDVGSLSLIDDTISRFSNDCPNAIIQTSILTKDEIRVTWTAPPTGSGCVVFRATVVEDHEVWYMDDGLLSLVLCEDVRESDSDQPDEVDKCCACEDAMYEMVFEGIWSKHTHPNDFPSNKWETAFSDMIGASHSAEYHFWEYGDFASRGLRRLAQVGDTHELENEIKSNGQNVRTIIKARGLRYPNVTGRTYSAFRVDTQNHLISIVSKIDPSPDWVVGVSGLNLCLKNCSWVQYKIINLYPWDVGSDSGISYNSPNSPTNPQQPISRITTSYPNDPSSPFYDATGEDMKPLAQLYLIRQQLYEKPCSNGDDPEPDPEEIPAECMVTNWSKWSQCSESCGNGEKFRQRSYLNKRKARLMGCTEELVQEIECHGSHPSCREGLDCEPMEWSQWGECSVTCGNGVETRTRRYRTRQEHKHCIGLPDSPELSENRECVGVDDDECDETSQENEDCPQTEWSSWSPCSASCGKGKRIRVLLSVEDENDAKLTSSDDCPQVDTIEEHDCFDLPSCDMYEELYRDLCLSPLNEGGCRRNNSRWYFDADTKTCQNFIYKGCYGNRNNFLTQEDCENTCVRGSEELLEEGEEDTTLDGPVGGLWPASQIIDPKGTYGIQDSTIPNYVLGSTQTEPYTVVDGPIVDCVVGRWTRWSSCSVSCGIGYKTRHRKIVIHPRNGGLACPKVFKRKRCRKACTPDDNK